MNNKIILGIILLVIILAIFVIFKLGGTKSKWGWFMFIIGFFALLVGIYLFPATMWRTICVTCLVIAVIMLSLGLATIIKARAK